MLQKDEYYFIKRDSELYLSTYLLKYVEQLELNNPDYVKEWLENQNDIYDIFNLLYTEKATLPIILNSYIFHGVIDNIICITHILEKEISVKSKFGKNTKYNLIDNKKVNNITDYLEQFRNSNYEIEIYIEGLNIDKLRKIILDYLILWEQNRFTSLYNNFYKKEKQVELVTQHIQDLLKDYDKNNLIIGMSNFNDGIKCEDISEYPINILATILYLEKIEYLSLKEMRIGKSTFYDLMFIVDIYENNKDVEEKNKLTFTLNNGLLSYKTSMKIFGKQKDLIDVLLKNKLSVSENEAYEHIYGDFRKNDPIRSLIVNTNKKLNQVGYKYKIHKENGRIVLDME